MGVEQFAQDVRGTGGVLSTTTQGTVQTDNFGHGGGILVDPSAGDSYPVAVNPAGVIHEFSVLSAGDVDVEVHTTGGDVFTLRLDGATGAWDHWDIDKLVISDPRSTGALFSGGWAGE